MSATDAVLAKVWSVGPHLNSSWSAFISMDVLSRPGLWSLEGSVQATWLQKRSSCLNSTFQTWSGSHSIYCTFFFPAHIFVELILRWSMKLKSSSGESLCQLICPQPIIAVIMRVEQCDAMQCNVTLEGLEWVWTLWSKMLFFLFLMLSLSNICNVGETFVLSPAVRAPEGLKHLQRKSTTSWQPHSVHFTFRVNDLVVFFVNLEPSCTEHWTNTVPRFQGIPFQGESTESGASWS